MKAPEVAVGPHTTQPDRLTPCAYPLRVQDTLLLNTPAVNRFLLQVNMREAVRDRANFVNQAIDEAIAERENPSPVTRLQWDLDVERYSNALDNPAEGIYGASQEEADWLNDPANEAQLIHENLENVLTHPTTKFAIASVTAMGILIPAGLAAFDSIVYPPTAWAQGDNDQPNISPQADVSEVTAGDVGPDTYISANNDSGLEADIPTEITQASSAQGQPDFQQTTRPDIPTDATASIDANLNPPQEEPTAVPTIILTPKPTPTPQPTPELPPGAYYAPWPAEIAAAMRRLVLPDNVRLVRSPNTPPGQPNCTRACYNFYPNGEKEVWIVDPPIAQNPSPELSAIAYELGHAHKQYIRESEGIWRCDIHPTDSARCWDQTNEYREFITALNTVNVRLRREGKPEMYTANDAASAHAHIFAGYIFGDPSFRNPPPNWERWVVNTHKYPELMSFMNKWAKR